MPKCGGSWRSEMGQPPNNMNAPNMNPTTLIYQAAKLGDIPYLIKDFELASRLDSEGIPIGRIYGNSSGALVALAHGLVLSARTDPDRFKPGAGNALDDFEAFFRTAKSRQIRRLNWRGMSYGFYNLNPLKRWLTARLLDYTGRDDLTLSDLAVPVYLCVQDKDGYPVFFGPPDDDLKAVYHNCSTRIEDAPIIDACIAALSTLLSTDAYPVNGHYYKDGRPVFADISPMVLDMEASDPRPIIKSEPYTPIPDWKPWAMSQPFIMHRWHERNQVDLASAYNALLARHRELQATLAEPDPSGPQIKHVRLPYIGSTEASTNMRDSVANQDQMIKTFRELGIPQLDGYDFAQPTTLIYGAGGFSGILAGLVMTRAVDERDANVQRIFGCSAGVINGLFHGVALGVRRHPDLYTSEANDALTHLVEFFNALTPNSLYRMNRSPRKLIRAIGNADPFRDQIAHYLERWTGCKDGHSLTFEDIQLPFYAVGARGSDGYLDVFGVSGDLEMQFAGRTMRPINCPIVDAMVGGMAQPFYITPPVIEGETYFDGGAAFYDIELFAAAMEPELLSMLSIHVVGPPDYSFGFDERPTLLRVIFDTHNFTFPEERRRMTAIINLLYEHEKLRRQAHIEPHEQWWRIW